MVDGARTDNTESNGATRAGEVARRQRFFEQKIHVHYCILSPRIWPGGSWTGRGACGHEIYYRTL